MSVEFGKTVYENALKLKEQGKDANQIVKILFDQDPEAVNYGIGIILGGDGKPVATSSTVLEYAAAELEQSKVGTYMNSSAKQGDLKKAVMKWQRIPEEYADKFILATPSDAGTGAVKTAVEIALMQNPQMNTLGIQEFGWPAYKTIAKTSRIQVKEYAGDGVIAGDGVLPLYQAGPMNTTGFVAGQELVEARAKSAAEHDALVVLDRAYSGFEFARLLAETSYDEVMRKSYELQIKPFIEHNAPFCLAVSPTKAFVTFALRPCGLLLIFTPDAEQKKAITTLVNTTMRARGSAFEHPVTRAFIKAMTQDLARLEAEHQTALERLAEAEALWRTLVQGTPMEYLYSEEYAGLFRNPPAKEDAAIHIYNEHIYPVLANQRCRQNVTGIPDDEELARKHVNVFAEQCY